MNLVAGHELTWLPCTHRVGQPVTCLPHPLAFWCTLVRAAYQLIKETASQSDIASHDDNERMRFDPRAEDLKRGKSFNSVASRVSRVSRYSRHPSVRVSMRAMPSLVKHDQ